MAIAPFVLLKMFSTDKGRRQAVTEGAVCRFLREEYGWSNGRYSTINVGISFIPHEFP